MRLSLVQTDDSCEETGNTGRETRGGIMVSRSNLAVGGDSSFHQKILGGSRKCTSDCQIFEQFEKEDGEERTHTSQLPG